MNLLPSALKHGIDPDDAMYVATHAMRMRTKYVKLMEGGRQWI
ncbi:hypothetical protein [Bifidobacterium leontopitheci]|nr:hypothetical protein [Bifidobacterium leontopitheci]